MPHTILTWHMTSVLSQAGNRTPFICSQITGCQTPRWDFEIKYLYFNIKFVSIYGDQSHPRSLEAFLTHENEYITINKYETIEHLTTTLLKYNIFS